MNLRRCRVGRKGSAPEGANGDVRADRSPLAAGLVLPTPLGVGLATIRSSARIGTGINPSGVMSAGNGAAMRAAVVGAFFHDRPEAEAQSGLRARLFAEVTHWDVRAVEALYVAEFAVACARCSQVADFAACQVEARRRGRPATRQGHRPGQGPALAALFVLPPPG